MAYFVRKISRAKWPDEECDVSVLNADAISDLRTTANTLSVWKIDELDELDNAVLALSASSKSERIETINVVWITEEEIKANGIDIDEDVPGDTVIESLVSSHRDLCNLSYSSIGQISKLIMQEIAHNNCKRYTKSQVKNVLVRAYSDDLITAEKCQKQLLLEIRKAATS